MQHAVQQDNISLIILAKFEWTDKEENRNYIVLLKVDNMYPFLKDIGGQNLQKGYSFCSSVGQS